MNCETCTWAVAELEKQLDELKAKCQPIKVEYAKNGSPLNAPEGIDLLLFPSNDTPLVGELSYIHPRKVYRFTDRHGDIVSHVTYFIEIPTLYDRTKAAYK